MQHLALSSETRANEYLKSQEAGRQPESLLPIHVGTNLGLSREVHTPGLLTEEFACAVHPDFAATLEVYVPSLQRIEAALATTPASAFDRALIRLDEMAREKGLPPNARDVHGNVWEIEEIVLLSGTMQYVQFVPNPQDEDEMQRHDGSLYSINTLEKAKQVAMERRRTYGDSCSIIGMREGDVVHCPGGYAHGLFGAVNAHYLVMITRGPQFEALAERFYGRGSTKHRAVREARRGLSSYWGEYSKVRKSAAFGREVSDAC